MQPGCDEIEFFISKSVDGEATPEERALVDNHVASCDSCAFKLTSFIEMAAVFSDIPLRAPDPQVRSGVFTEINRLKEADRRVEEIRAASSNSPHPYLPGQTPVRITPRNSSLGAKLWSIGSPFAVMGTAVALVIVLMAIAVPPEAPQQAMHAASASGPLIPNGVGTKAASNIYQDFVSDHGIPSPVVTRAATSYRVSTVSATVRSTAAFVGDRMIELSEPTAVLESGDPTKLSNWHLLRDPAFGYSVSYPPNWWTQVIGTVRYFYPWGIGGVKYAPYWIEFSVQDNPHGYTAETANEAMFAGACKIETGTSGRGKCLRRTSSDSQSIFDEIYTFDPTHIYILRAKVPIESSLGDFQPRWQQVQDIVAIMSGSLSLAPVTSHSASGYGPILFLNGSDLWSANTGSSGARPITRGYVVRQFALSPDLRHIAISATNDANDRFADARYTYIVDAEGDTPGVPQLLSTGLTVYEIAWYGERTLLAVGRSGKGALGIYSMPVNLQAGSAGDSIETTPRLLTQLPADITAARGLAVSPDRQLITFLAPLGETKGTDIYALRPDGSDVRRLVSHTDPTPPETGQEDALTAENQALKSYTWLTGKLENGKYYLDLLFTCGTFSSPTLYRGGFLYSASGAGRGTLLDPSRLNVEDPAQVQIVHVASSPQGKVAFTGFYNLRKDWVEMLAGLWTADYVDGKLINLKQQPMPAAPNGISDLQWSPDGTSLIYRETLPRDTSSMISRYEGDIEFKLIDLDPGTGQRTTLYDATHH